MPHSALACLFPSWSVADKMQQQQQPQKQRSSSPPPSYTSKGSDHHPEDDEIKEWHFHVYFFQDNKESHKSALELREKILRLVDEGFFKVVPLDRVNVRPIGPHPIGSYEVWVPREHLPRALSFFTLNRGTHSVLLHPLTRFERADHSDRAMWLGNPVPLDLSLMPVESKDVPLQYPELGLGYSASK